MSRLIFSFVTLFLISLSFSSCSAKKEKASDEYYDRANKAAKEAHDKFDKE